MKRMLAVFPALLLLSACEPKTRFEINPGVAQPYENGEIKAVHVARFRDNSGSAAAPHVALKTALTDALKDEGYTLVNTPEEADVVLEGTVTVYRFQPKDDLTMVPGVIIPGCIPCGLPGAVIAWYLDDTTHTGELLYSAEVQVRNPKTSQWVKNTFHVIKVEKNRGESEFVMASSRTIAAKAVGSLKK